MSEDKLLADCDNIQKHGDIYFAECFIQRGRNGKGCYLLQKAAPLYDNNGRKVGAIESIQDITERKIQEEHLKYLSMHDTLTGLYNRAYLEQEINRVENEGLYPVSVMLCDLDGLKAV
ncbi:MAG: diguanylate cyclase, partial [Desulfotomaculum sp.]|nr:diguanylate cyclase [Desulfotomaculum sp.]